MFSFRDGYTIFAEDLSYIDELLGASREQLRGARLFITGGTGFFGIWLVESLLFINERHDLDLSLVILTRDAGAFRAGKGKHLSSRPELSLVEGSLVDFDTGSDRFTHILHLASESNVDNLPGWAGRHVSGVLDGTRAILDLAVRSRAKGTLLTSSGAVYLGSDRTVDNRSVEGFATLGEVIGEKNSYGQAKRTMELLGAISAAEHDHRVLIARCFAFVGPYLPLDANYAIGNFIRDAMAGRQIVVNGDGTPLRSYLYAADLAGQLLKLLLEGQSGIPYNVGGDEIVSISQLAHRVAAIAATGCTVDVKQSPQPGAIANAYVPQTSRIRQALSLAEPVSLDEGIARTIEWHRARR